MEARCLVCHRQERWTAEKGREVLMEGGTRRPASSLVRAAFDVLAAAVDGEAILGTCDCGMPLVGSDAASRLSVATPFQLRLREGELVAAGHRVELDGGEVDWPALTRIVHRRFPAVEPDPTSTGERVFAFGLLSFTVVPVTLWVIAVMVVVTFYRQWATYGVPGGP